MRDHAGVTLDGSAPVPLGPADESFLDTPNCPLCLSRLEAVETEPGGVHWACTTCGFAAVA